MTMEDLIISADEQQAITIKEELREDEDRMLNNIKLLKEWIKCTTYLPQVYDESILVPFLRGCKHDMEKTKKKIEMYFIIYCTDQEFIGERPSTLDIDLKSTEFIATAMSPRLTPEGYRPIFIKLKVNDADKIDFLRYYRLFSRLADIKFAEDVFIAGEIIIIDASMATPQILAKFISNLTKKAITMALDAYPVRLRAIHVICNIPFIENLLNMLKSILKDKLMKRIYFHKNCDKLPEHVPLKCLPEDYGGPQKSIEKLSERWTNEVLNRKDMYRRISEMKLNGPIPKKIQERKCEMEYGVQGSFRKLNLD